AVWTAGAAVRLPLPHGLAADALARAREGFPIPYFQVASIGDATGAKDVLVSPALDTYRLPTLFELDLRLSRELALRGGRLTAGVDAFNALNRGTTLQVSRDVELPAFSRAREVLRPRELRLALEYAF